MIIFFLPGVVNNWYTVISYLLLYVIPDGVCKYHLVLQLGGVIGMALFSIF